MRILWWAREEFAQNSLAVPAALLFVWVVVRGSCVIVGHSATGEFDLKAYENDIGFKTTFSIRNMRH